MSDLSNIVSVTINRETQSVSRAGFGVLAICSEFSTSKATSLTGRYQYYASLTEMTDDGWLTSDREYLMAQDVFSQNPKVEQIMIGRRDSGDAAWADALGAIQIAQQDWYAFTIIPTDAKTVQIVFSEDFVASNSIALTLNGTAVTAVPFNTDHDTTMSDLETQIEADVTGATATLTDVGGDNRTITVSITDKTATVDSLAVTGGASQPTSTITNLDTNFVAEYKEAAAWCETQKKLFFFCSDDSDIKGSGSADIASFMKAQNYDRTICMYHDYDLGDEEPSNIEAAWPAENLPYDPGSQTWAFKTIAGVAAYGLTSAERGYILGKNANIYTTTAGVANTEFGTVASGEYIDIMRGLDWLESRIQEDVFSALIEQRKIPFTDAGITSIEGILKGVLDEGARKGLLVADTIETTVPKAEDVSAADKAARTLPDVTFTATLQGAIHKVTIVGTVTL